MYWSWETRLKTAESAVDSCLGANGAIYAIRGRLFPGDFQPNTVVDDFVIGMKVREQGYRLVYEPAATAMEELPSTIGDEWRRRVRIGAGAYQSLAMCRRCLLPRYGAFAWMFWSHKVFRWFTPHLGLVVLFAWVGLLVSGSAHPMLTVVGGLGLLTGLAGWLLRDSTVPLAKPLRSLGYFVAMQAALFAGFLRYCRGNLTGAWARTQR